MGEIISMLWVFFIIFYFGVGTILLVSIDNRNQHSIIGSRPYTPTWKRIIIVVLWPLVAIIYLIFSGR